MPAPIPRSRKITTASLWRPDRATPRAAAAVGFKTVTAASSRSSRAASGTGSAPSAGPVQRLVDGSYRPTSSIPIDLGRERPRSRASRVITPLSCPSPATVSTRHERRRCPRKRASLSATQISIIPGSTRTTATVSERGSKASNEPGRPLTADVSRPAATTTWRRSRSRMIAVTVGRASPLRRINSAWVSGPSSRRRLTTLVVLRSRAADGPAGGGAVAPPFGRDPPMTLSIVGRRLFGKGY